MTVYDCIINTVNRRHQNIDLNGNVGSGNSVCISINLKFVFKEVVTYLDNSFLFRIVNSHLVVNVYLNVNSEALFNVCSTISLYICCIKNIDFLFKEDVRIGKNSCCFSNVFLVDVGVNAEITYPSS